MYVCFSFCIKILFQQFVTTIIIWATQDFSKHFTHTHTHILIYSFILTYFQKRFVVKITTSMTGHLYFCYTHTYICIKIFICH